MLITTRDLDSCVRIMIHDVHVVMTQKIQYTLADAVVRATWRYLYHPVDARLQSPLQTRIKQAGHKLLVGDASPFARRSTR